jgi:hypothetical protein
VFKPIKKSIPPIKQQQYEIKKEMNWRKKKKTNRTFFYLVTPQQHYSTCLTG